MEGQEGLVEVRRLAWTLAESMPGRSAGAHTGGMTKSYSFQCTGFLIPLLDLFLGIFFSFCHDFKWDWFLNFCCL